jgi:hypothetical protein
MIPTYNKSRLSCWSGHRRERSCLLHVFQHGSPFLFELFKMGWSKTGYFLELG